MTTALIQALRTTFFFLVVLHQNPLYIATGGALLAGTSA